MNQQQARLRAVQNESAQYVAGSDIMRDAADEIAALRAQRDELAEALRAFTDFPADLLQCFVDDPTGTFTFTVPIEHMAAAVTALAKLEVHNEHQ